MKNPIKKGQKYKVNGEIFKAKGFHGSNGIVYKTAAKAFNKNPIGEIIIVKNKNGAHKLSECELIELDINVSGNSNVIISKGNDKKINSVNVKGDGNLCISGCNVTGSINL